MDKTMLIDMLDISIKEHLHDIESISFIDMLKSVSLLQIAYHRIKTNPKYHGMWNWSFLLNLFMNNKIVYTQYNDIPVDLLIKIYDGSILRNYKDYESNEEIKNIVKQYIYCLASKLLINILGVTENELETLPLLKAFSESPLMINFDQYTSYSQLKFYDDINKEENDSSVSAEGQYSSVYDIYEIFPTEFLPEIFKTRKSAYQDIANTKTTLSNLTALSLSILKGDAILLTGPTGSGKSFCIQHLANVTNNNDFITVHLGDSSDAKLLLGTYVCTDKPGQFKWIPGMLTRAVKEGKWIVIEDIDLAPPEILSALLPVVEKRQLFIPSRGEVIHAKEGFQLFATKTTSNHHSLSRNDSILSNLWRRVVIDPLSREELEHVIHVQFPELSILKSSIVETYFKLLEIFSTSHVNKEEITKENLPSLVSISTVGNRHISTRDVMKWCVRIKSEIGNVLMSANIVASNIREIVFREAIDCFCGSIPDLKLKDYMVDIIRNIWNISTDRMKYYLNQYIPVTKTTKNEFSVGRVTLPILKKSQSIYQHESSEEKKSIYCYNRHSLLLLERIAQSIKLNEPVLLVGETGEGKTSTIQHLASKLNHKLVVLNLNQQSDSVDLLGGFKPVEIKMIFKQIKESFVSLFTKTFSRKKNQAFLNQVHQAYMNQQWNDLIRLFKKAIALANKKFDPTLSYTDEDQTKHKRQKSMDNDLARSWEEFKATVNNYEDIDQLKSNFAFSFVEGSLVKAVKEGHWVLLDEINLASHETLECLTGLLEGNSLTLNERGDSEPIKRHPSFRLIACMNPPTDIGKKDLPPALRNRFTEFIIHGLTDFDDLKKFVESHLESVNGGHMSSDIVDFYLKAKNEVTLTDGSNQRPHYSLRTLARALEYCRDNTPIYGFNRSLIDGITMSFTTQLSSSSYPVMMNLIRKCLIDKMKGVNLNVAPKVENQDEYVQFEQFLLKKGPYEVYKDPKYILTPTISRQLVYLARILTTGKYPILLQGPTSSGKTSMIEYLAGCTGHRFVRINNHENTDVQEYIGHYISDSNGKLYFQEGILVEALRKGYWVVLDELNLAPSEVLESLNRLLDDNRELFIPETQETIKPHKHFMLFATQNPPGLYGGRKVLSRAFRNRFIEFHFDDIPDDELETILTQRCSLPQSYCKKLILIMKDLQRHRQGSRVFAGRHGFVTLRDLFRWAGRSPSSYEELAKHGYFLLADRLRDPTEKEIVKEVLEKHLKVKIDENKMIDEEFNKYPHDLYVDHPLLSKIVWTRAMKRMFVLIGISLRFKEPILLVGETGTGKTTVCQLHAYLLSQKLHIINCHEHTETADFIGGLRPIRGKNKLFDSLLLSLNTLFKFVIDNNIFDDDEIKEIREYLDNSSENIKKGIELSMKVVKLAKSKGEIDDINIRSIISKIIDYSDDVNMKYKDYSSMFTWYDGPLIKAMKSGDMILFDEISLAEDAILERLNSVLEPKRLLVIAEKGGENIEELIAHCDFRIMATMNPGGDFGKKELSPALRNRFTELWIPHSNDRDDLKRIICERMSVIEEKDLLSDMMLDFIDFFGTKSGRKTSFSLRDILSWVDFILNQYDKIGVYHSYLHGAHLVVLDGLGITDPLNAEILHNHCLQFLIDQIQSLNVNVDLNEFNTMKLEVDQSSLRLGPFSISKGPNQSKETRQYTFECKTTQENLLRLLRALQLSKPILLEGNPGVGKTSIVEALGAATGHRVVRINLSDQTDMIDLLGADLPEENTSYEGDNNDPRFSWRDGVFLNALKNGDWVLLDEMNLANQSVLEGLNSVLDHRGTVFIPELGETFVCPPSFRIFACQNPTHQGGGRKGLPKSFLNRFTKVYVNKFTTDDLMFISSSLYPQINQNHLQKMIEFNQRLYHETMVEHLYGKDGSPWEFNLRDILRWCFLIDQSIHKDPSKFVDILYLQRFRKIEDRLLAIELFEKVFNTKLSLDLMPYYHISPEFIQVGQSILPRRFSTKKSISDSNESPLLLQKMLNPLESLMKCVELGWFTILMGSTASGKSSLIKYLADITGNKLNVFSINSSIDTMELLGGFEQVDITRHKKNLLSDLKDLITFVHRICIRIAFSHKVKDILNYSKRIEDMWQSLNQSDIILDTSSSQNEGFTDEQYNLMNQIVSLSDQVLSNYNEVNEERVSLGILSPLELRNEIKNMKIIEKQSAYGSFEWVNGLLIQSLIRGDWIVMDNANLCPGPVLDRLLPLLEPNGLLQLNERGLIDGKTHEIRPHPNFRIFFTVDPQYGEISRAMRNRGIEIYLLDSDIEQLDNYRLLESKLHIGKELCLKMAHFHNKLASTKSNQNEDNIHVSDVPLTLRELLHWRDLTHTLIQKGVPLKKALFIAMEQVYVRCRYHSDDRNAVIRLYGKLFPSINLDINKLKTDSLAYSHIPPTSLYPIHSKPFVNELTSHHNDINRIIFSLSLFLSRIGVNSLYTLKTILQSFITFGQHVIHIDQNVIQWIYDVFNYFFDTKAGHKIHFKHFYRWNDLIQNDKQKLSFSWPPIGHEGIYLNDNDSLIEYLQLSYDNSESFMISIDLSKRIYMVLDFLYFSWKFERIAAHHEQSTKINDMDVIECSLNANNILNKDLINEVIPYIYPFFSMMKDQIAEWITVDERPLSSNDHHKLGLIIVFINDLLEILRIPVIEFDLAKFSIQWRYIVKLFNELTNNSELLKATPSLIEYIGNIESVIQDKQGNKSKSLLRKGLGTGFKFKTKKHHELNDLFLNIPNIQYLPYDIKSMVTQCLATIYSMNKESINDEERYQSFVEISMKMNQDIQPVESELDIIYSYKSMRNEYMILSKVYECFMVSNNSFGSSNDEKMKILLNLLSKYIQPLKNTLSYILKYTKRSPYDIAMYQLLIWIIEMEEKPFSKDSQIISYDLIIKIIQECLYRFKSRLLTSEFSRYIDWKFRFDDKAPNNEQQQEDDDEILHDYGLLRLERSFISTYIVRLLGQWKHASVVKREEIKQGLHMLLNEFSPNSKMDLLNGEDIIRSDWMIQLSTLYSYIAVYIPTMDQSNLDKLINYMNIMKENIEKQNNVSTTFTQDMLNSMNDIISTSNDASFIYAYNHYIKPSIELFYQFILSKNDFVLSSIGRGKIMIYLALAKLYLIALTESIDPNTKLLLKIEQFDRLENILKERIEILKTAERIFTGKDINKNIIQYEHMYRYIKEKSSKIVEKSFERPENRADFATFFNDLKNFFSFILSKTTIVGLLDDIPKERKIDADSMDFNFNSITARENYLQYQLNTSITIFEQYRNSYSDIITPILDSIITIKRGFRVFKDFYDLKMPLHSQIESPDIIYKGDAITTIQNLIIGLSGAMLSDKSTLLSNILSTSAFDHILKLKQHIEDVEKKKTINIVQLNVQILESSLFSILRHIQTSSHLNHDQFYILLNIFNIYIDIHRKIQHDEEEREKEAQRLYKYRTRTITFEKQEEIDEKDFNELFPDYIKAYEEILEVTDMDNNEIDQEKKDKDEKITYIDEYIQSYKFTDDDIYRLCRTHYQIFSYLFKQHHHEDSFIFDDSFSVMFKAISNLITLINDHNFNPNMDDHLESAHILALKYMIDKHDTYLNDNIVKKRINTRLIKDGFIDSSEMIENFYTLSVPSEAILIVKPLEDLKGKIEWLLNEVGNNEILRRLFYLINNLLNLSLDKPLVQFMIGLEVLLERSLDWESYHSTSATYSIEPYLLEIRKLVNRFRRKELNYWPNILNYREQQFQIKSSKWWFHLYALLSKENDMINIHSALRQFMEASCYGDFSFRLNLLLSFYYQYEIEKRFNPPSDDSIHISDVIYNTYRYYLQFMPYLEKEVDFLKEEIENDLKSFIKLTGEWNILNHYKLKESTAKSHRTLNKAARSYEEKVLSVPVMTLFNKIDSIILDQQKDEFKENISPNSYVFHYEQKDNDLLSSYFNMNISLLREMNEKIVKTEILRCNDAFDILEGISIGIASHATSLKQKGTTPLKKRALNDLMKYLEHMGLTYHRSEINIDQMDKFYLFSQEAMERDIRMVGSIYNNPQTQSLMYYLDKSNEYFYKNVTKLLLMRDAQSQHSVQLTPTEVHKTSGYAEHLFTHLLNQRKFIIKTLKNHLSIQKFMKSFESMVIDNNESNIKDVKVQSSYKEAILDIKQHVDSLSLNLYTLIKIIMAQQLEKKDDELKAILKLIDKCRVDIHDKISLIYDDIEKSSLYIVSNNYIKSLDGILMKIKEEIENLDKVLDKIPHKITFRVRENIESLYSLMNKVENMYIIYSSSSITLKDIEKDDEWTNSFVHLLKSSAESIKESIESIMNVYNEVEVISHTETTIKDTENDGDNENQDGYSHSGVPQVQNMFFTNLESFTLKLLSSTQGERIIEILLDIASKYHEYMDNEMNAHKIPYVMSILRHFSPIFIQFGHLHSLYLYSLVKIHKSSSKLEYVLLNLFTNLYKDGFCVPDDEVEMEEGDLIDNVEGVGLGEGEGNRDITDQIKDEEEVLGEKTERNEQDETGEKPPVDPDTGLEMENDFDGEIRDVEKKEGENDEDEDEDESKDIDNDMGEVDPNESEVVDEKLKDEEDEEEEGEDGNNKDEKYEKNAPLSSKQQDSEIMAKPEDDVNENEYDNDKKDDKNDEDMGEESGENEFPEINEDGEENYEDNHFKKPQEQEEEFELPDNMEIDDQMDEENGQEEQEGEENEKENENKEEAMDLEDHKDFIDDSNQNVDMEEGEHVDNNDEDKNQEDNEDQSVNEGNNVVEEDLNEEKEDQEDRNIQNNLNQDNNQQNNESMDAYGVEDNISAPQTNIRQMSDRFEQRPYQEEMNPNFDRQQQEQLNPSYGQDSQKVESDDLNSQRNEEEQRESMPNPLRSLGDALKSWKRRLEVVDDHDDHDENIADENNDEQNENEGDEDNLYQYTHDNERYDNQTLGIASEEQAKEFNMDMDELEDKEEEDNEEAAKKNQNKEEEEDHKDGNEESKNISSNIASKDMKISIEMDKASEEPKSDDESMELEVEKPEEEKEDIDEDEEDKTVVSNQIIERISSLEIEKKLTYDDIISMRQDLEVMISKWRSDSNNIELGAKIWRDLQTLTSTSAQQLCEQLRLILEPTQKAKLKGDYRTGKRLNMRRVITYVASQFRKDKIWLRRMQPNKRSYQVMIALDDSESIELLKASHLVREATSMICIALQRLEIGQISIMKFGEDVTLLHPFSHPFTDEAASIVMPQLTFKQKSTNIEALLSTATQVMQLSRVESTNQNEDIMQIMFIIGDGRFGDKRHNLLKWLNEAKQKNIFIVFLIIDGQEKDQSILDIQTITYPNGKLTIKPYIDDFPFYYYIILKKLDNLPQVLADALRQWFEMLQR